MVNVQFNYQFILGLAVLLASIGFYFVRTFKPDVSRDYDIVFSAASGLSGLILMWQGWRLDPILWFGQVLMAGTAGFFIFETLRLRQIATVQARRSEPIIEDDPPIRRSYKVDLDDTRRFDEPTRRRSPRPIRSADEDDVDRYSRPAQLAGDTPPRRRRPRPVEGEVTDAPPRRRPRPVDGEVSDVPTSRRPAGSGRRPPTGDGGSPGPTRPRRPRPVEPELTDIDVEINEPPTPPISEDRDDRRDEWDQRDDLPPQRPRNSRPRPNREVEPTRPIDIDVDEDFGGEQDFEEDRPRRPHYDEDDE
ncbi:Ycf66 family protein [Leptolyngbya sp. FACHB-261]|uniref:Ycf66 family protein n=1 Tax=Leptolyngbya sp. FACHB-261 TaxID=2692806 RepID=UPI0016822268|nr:Ycf66 family protein [Leptolyngbya sp. FACHB-261]MBD2103478.1 Ycf66 family protein [Leptolyngbya sp. FACHB-261]